MTKLNWFFLAMLSLIGGVVYSLALQFTFDFTVTTAKQHYIYLVFACLYWTGIRFILVKVFKIKRIDKITERDLNNNNALFVCNEFN